MKKLLIILLILSFVGCDKGDNEACYDVKSRFLKHGTPIKYYLQLKNDDQIEVDLSVWGNYKEGGIYCK